MTRDELLNALRDSRAQVEAALAGLTEAQMTEAGALGEWSVKDILSHLTAWEAEAVTALAKVKRGLQPGKIPWEQAEVDALNAKWHKENRPRPLDRVLADFRGVRAQMIRQVESFDDQDLNAPRAWFRKRTLVELIRAETFEHEAEHLPQLLEWRRKVESGKWQVASDS
jgi:uncharacterized protein (TIGR03083 family)